MEIKTTLAQGVPKRSKTAKDILNWNKQPKQHVLEKWFKKEIMVMEWQWQCKILYVVTQWKSIMPCMHILWVSLENNCNILYFCIRM
jgi:hypothetical protein